MTKVVWRRSGPSSLQSRDEFCYRVKVPTIAVTHFVKSRRSASKWDGQRNHLPIREYRAGYATVACVKPLSAENYLHFTILSGNETVTGSEAVPGAFSRTALAVA